MTISIRPVLSSRQFVSNRRLVEMDLRSDRASAGSADLNQIDLKFCCLNASEWGQILAESVKECTAAQTLRPGKVTLSDCTGGCSANPHDVRTI